VVRMQLQLRQHIYCVKVTFLFLSRHRSAETQCWRRRYVRTYVRTSYVRGTYRLQCACASNGTENSITLTIYTSEHVFIALGWHLEMIMGFHEYAYQDCEYIIRAMNTRHAQCKCLYIQLVTKLYTYGSSCLILSTFVIKLGNASQL